MPLAIVVSAALTLLALPAPVLLVVALVRAGARRTRAAGLRLLAWEAAGGALGMLLMVLLHLAGHHRLRAVTAEGLAYACAAGLTAGAVAYALARVRSRPSPHAAAP